MIDSHYIIKAVSDIYSNNLQSNSTHKKNLLCGVLKKMALYEHI